VKSVNGLRGLQLRFAICALGFAALVSARPAATPTVVPSANDRCALGLGSFRDDAPCAPFTVVSANVLATFSASVFWGGLAYNRRSLAVLNDGTVMVAAGRGGLFRIDRQNHVTALWAPSDSNYGSGDSIELLAPFAGGVVVSIGNVVLGIREDGSLQFRKQVESSRNGGRTNAIEDRDGTVWLQNLDAPDTTTYAYFPHDGLVKAVPKQIATGQIFPGADRRVFMTATDGIFELRSVPRFERRFVRAPVTLPPGMFARPGIDAFTSSLHVQAAGRDGSFWGSTLTQIVHVLPDGTIRALRLAPPIMWMSMPPRPFELTMAPDGSVWTASPLARVTDDDQIQKVVIADHDGWRLGPSFAPDGSLWTDVTKGNQGDESVVHVTLAPTTSETATVTDAARPSRTATTLSPAILPAGKPPLDGRMGVFLPLMGDPWSCSATGPQMTGFPAFPKTFSISFLATGGPYVIREMRGDGFYIRTSYEHSGDNKFISFTNDDSIHQSGGYEELFSEETLSFSGINKPYNSSLVSVEERYDIQAATRFTIYKKFYSKTAQQLTIACSRRRK
jgi:hypothetical protein